MNAPGFTAKRGRVGFHITFENGYTISVQFDGGNYCDNYDLPYDKWNTVAESRTAECAVMNKDDNLIEIPGANDCVTDRSTPADVLRIMNWAAGL